MIGALNGRAALLSAALLVGAAFVAQQPAAEVARLTASRSEVAIGERFELLVEAPAGLAGELWLRAMPELDAAVALVDRAVDSVAGAAVDGGTGARLHLQLVACAAGRCELGPFDLILRGDARSELPITSDATSVTIRAPWGEAPTPPFAEWRVVAPRTEEAGAHRLLWWLIAAALLTAAAVIAIVARRRRQQPAAFVQPPPAATDLRVLAQSLPLPVEERRQWCAAVEQALRAEFAARSSAARFAWSRAELLVLRGAGAWPTAFEVEWSNILAALERGRFARPSAPELAGDFGQRIARLLAERSP